ncbi:MAG TPA: type III pantothenate kinase [Taishania sp.]|nr:type III pantothenate kinase [Taishania sp.]
MVDLGNTATKLGYFEDGNLVKMEVVDWNELISNKYLVGQVGMVTSVVSTEMTSQLLQTYPNFILFDSEKKMPVKLDYHTPNSLGKDRICNAVGAWAVNPNANSLVIDVGTCIKYDFVSSENTYQGGAISPGIRLRYRALNDYTANLPLLTDVTPANLIGKSTHEAIHSGVINGMQAEMNQIIKQYEDIYDSLTIFVTGGDMNCFELVAKNNIFANKNLTLEGLYQIYVFNVE